MPVAQSSPKKPWRTPGKSRPVTTRRRRYGVREVAGAGEKGVEEGGGGEASWAAADWGRGITAEEEVGGLRW